MEEWEGEMSEGTRVEELLRVNAELAAEVRALADGRTDAPRRGRVPAARGIARMHAEREALTTRLAETQAALDHLQGVQAALDEVSAERERLSRENETLAAEVVRLRSGWQGLLRRARGRLLRRG
jgi:predicted nuclease with TOPRIM domain